MDKKFIAAVIICVVALLSVTGGTIYLGQKSSQSENNTSEKNKVAQENQGFNDYLNSKDAYSIVNEPEETTDNSNFEETSEYNSVFEEPTTKQKVVEANTESNVDSDDYLYGLSSEAAAKISELDFGESSILTLPVTGAIIMPFNVDGTVYYATLDEYKTNSGIVIESSKGTEVKAAANGVITVIEDDTQLGLYIDQAIGDGYVATYGQVIDPIVETGEYVTAGQTIAYVNEPTKYYTVEGDNVYFAITKDGESIDPLNFVEY